jgi:rod shape-determining protein MreB and related proteins
MAPYRRFRFRRDLALDVGTANTTIVSADGSALVEPSLVAFTEEGREIVAVGRDAEEMLGRTPRGLHIVRPLRSGAVDNFELLEAMLSRLVSKFGRKVLRPRVIVCAASASGEKDRTYLASAVGGAACVFVEKPVAAAWGAGLPAERPVASMIVDVGAATTEVAVVTLNGIATGHTAPVGGDDFSRAITRNLLDAHELIVGERTAEAVKRRLGSTPGAGGGTTLEVAGCDASTGFPKSVKVGSVEISRALAHPLGEVVAAVKRSLADMAPELAGDLVDRGITLTGGGSLLPGLPELLRYETERAVFRAEGPLTCAAFGALRMTGLGAQRRQTRKALVPRTRSRAEDDSNAYGERILVDERRFDAAPAPAARAELCDADDVHTVNVFRMTYRRRRRRRLDAVIRRAHEALRNSSSSGDWVAEADALRSLGLAYVDRGDYGVAIEPLHAALSIARRLEDEKREIELLADLAWAYREIDWDRAFHFGRTACEKAGPAVETIRALSAWLPLAEEVDTLGETQELEPAAATGTPGDSAARAEALGEPPVPS